MNTKINKDSEASPFITQKGVILCRSGIQYYHKSEVAAFITADNHPPVEKEWYREYRPANVVVKAKELCRSLPVAKEHPDVFINSTNFSNLAGGVTDNAVEVVALEGESEGEIGLKSDLTFFTDTLYDYYTNNKEVSLGYTCKKHFVDNPEEVGYDILLDEITEVNHLAITRAGRGGSSVAVIDSIIGGIKPMRTGIFAWLASKKQSDSAPLTFSKVVFDSIKNSKGTTEAEVASEMKGVLDFCSVLKDGTAKDTLLNAVRDCFDNKTMALDSETELSAKLDSMFEKAHLDSMEGLEDEEETKDSEVSEEKKEEEEKSEDSEVKEETTDSEEKKEEEEKSEDSEVSEEKKDEDGCGSTKDSAPVFATKDDIVNAINDSLKPMVLEAVKEVLNIKSDKTASVEGLELDSANKGNICRDYSEFLEA